jgi:hypothetical protein
MNYRIKSFCPFPVSRDDILIFTKFIIYFLTIPKLLIKPIHKQIKSGVNKKPIHIDSEAFVMLIGIIC